MEPKLYSITELSPILKLHPKTLARFIHEGKIKARKIGRSWMVNEDALREYARGEFAVAREPKFEPDYASLSERITVSTVIEIIE
jgi:excisionase family DNA binding protein